LSDNKLTDLDRFDQLFPANHTLEVLNLSGNPLQYCTDVTRLPFVRQLRLDRLTNLIRADAKGLLFASDGQVCSMENCRRLRFDSASIDRLDSLSLADATNMRVEKDFLAQFQKLKELSIAGTRLDSMDILKSFTNFSRLEYLNVSGIVDLSSKNITETKIWANFPPKCRVLDISGMGLTAVNFTPLRADLLLEFYASTNNFTQLNLPVDKLQSLRILDLSHNLLTSLPKLSVDMATLPKVEYLLLSNNQIADIVPSIVHINVE
jgi:Leucine-rich repeat (LRR) protein